MDNLNIVKKNLILTTAIGYKFDQIKLFVKSLRVFYNGAITFLIGEKGIQNLFNVYISKYWRNL